MKRFKDNKDGTITDKDTGLVWLKDAGIVGRKTWEDANNACKKIRKGGKSGWRLPTVKELQSLIDYTNTNSKLALPKEHPFVGVLPTYYWSSTTGAAATGYAWVVGLGNGDVSFGGNDALTYYVWPVRGKVERHNGKDGWWIVEGLRHMGRAKASSAREAIEKCEKAGIVHEWEGPTARFWTYELPEAF